LIPHISKTCVCASDLPSLVDSRMSRLRSTSTHLYRNDRPSSVSVHLTMVWLPLEKWKRESFDPRTPRRLFCHLQIMMKTTLVHLEEPLSSACCWYPSVRQKQLRVSPAPPLVVRRNRFRLRHVYLKHTWLCSEFHCMMIFGFVFVIPVEFPFAVSFCWPEFLLQ